MGVGEYMWRGIEEGDIVSIATFFLLIFFLFIVTLVLIKCGGLWAIIGGVMLVLEVLILNHSLKVMNTKPKEWKSFVFKKTSLRAGFCL